MRTLTRLAGLGMALVLFGTAACTGEQASSGPASTAQAYAGTRLPPSIRLPDVTLTGMDGRPYALRERTAGKITMLFFGYTHCPDICPTTMVDVSRTLKRLTPAERAKVQMVFISADPARDTPKALKAFLGKFDPSFIGLTGPLSTIHRAAAEVKVGLGDIPAHPKGNYAVEHGSQLLAFGPDGGGRLLFSYGTDAASIATDLKTLVKKEGLA